jgi:hypothetical protein
MLLQWRNQLGINLKWWPCLSNADYRIYYNIIAGRFKTVFGTRVSEEHTGFTLGWSWKHNISTVQLVTESIEKRTVVYVLQEDNEISGPFPWNVLQWIKETLLCIWLILLVRDVFRNSCLSIEGTVGGREQMENKVWNEAVPWHEWLRSQVHL